MQACRSCGAAIFFKPTTGDASIPLDAEPNPAGNVILERDLLGQTFARVLGKGEHDVPGTRYMPHFATCPNWEHR